MSRRDKDIARDPERPTIAWKKTFDGVNFFTTKINRKPSDFLAHLFEFKEF